MADRIRWEGMVVVDKPAGLTSHDVVARLRRISGQRRVGHAGTLDPLATGVLLVCLGRATRLIEYLVEQPKTYETRIRLGQTTDSYDADGSVMDDRPVTADQAAIAAALAPFRGPIAQIPPMYSAIKRDGQPLYKLARQGKVVAREPRQVTIYELTLLGWENPFLDLRIVSSAGTYIRSLAHDLGQALGCGGHVTALRRTAIGRFTAADAFSLAALEQEAWPAALLPTDTVVAHLPRVDLSAAAAADIALGRRVQRAPGAAPPLVRAYDDEGQFIAILKPAADDWQAHKVFLRS